MCLYGGPLSGTRRLSIISISLRTEESQHSFTHMLADVCCNNKWASPILYFFSSGILSISSVMIWTPRDFGFILTNVWNQAVGPLAAMFFRVETENARLHSTISPKKLIREIATNLSRTDNRKTGNLLILIFCIINIHILVKFSQSTDNFLHQDQL